MNLLVNPRIHIAPVGFEIERVVTPTIENRADLVYLLVHNNVSADKSKPYADEIRKQLKKNKIQYKDVYADRNNLLEIVKTVKEIIIEHRNSEIFINVSSGSKIQAIGCMMGCMIFDDRKNLRPYYVEPVTYVDKPQTTGVKKTHPLVAYQMQTPKPELLEICTIIKERGRIKKSELADIAIQKKIISVNSTQNLKMARFTSLDKNIITPLKNIWNFIEEEKVGRNRYVFLTEDGKLASQFLF
ncbi:MAG: DUF6293 family protein [Candidatus Nanopelagicaceae bacterium]